MGMNGNEVESKMCEQNDLFILSRIFAIETVESLVDRS